MERADKTSFYTIWGLWQQWLPRCPAGLDLLLWLTRAKERLMKRMPWTCNPWVEREQGRRRALLAVSDRWEFQAGIEFYHLAWSVEKHSSVFRADSGHKEVREGCEEKSHGIYFWIPILIIMYFVRGAIPMSGVIFSRIRSKHGRKYGYPVWTTSHTVENHGWFWKTIWSSSGAAIAFWGKWQSGLLHDKVMIEGNHQMDMQATSLGLRKFRRNIWKQFLW